MQNKMSMKIGIVDVGGGLRGVYAAGVLDYCMDRGIRFDLGIGVSAGSANLASYAAGQRGRNHQFYTEYAFRKQYMSFGNFITKKSYIDLDYVYGTLCHANGENPLDCIAIQENPMDFYVVAAEAQTGQAKYFDKTDMHIDDYSILKASSAIPFICKPCSVGDSCYFDGALGDPVPVEKAYQLGCDCVVLLLTKPECTVRNPETDRKLAALIRKKYPASAEALSKRAQRYNAGVAFAQEKAKQGKALIVAPEDTCGVNTLTWDKAALQRLYEKGYADGQKIESYLQN